MLKSLYNDIGIFNNYIVINNFDLNIFLINDPNNMSLPHDHACTEMYTIGIQVYYNHNKLWSINQNRSGIIEI